MYYADDGISFLDLGFENDVNMYGTQAAMSVFRGAYKFENDVNMYGTQADMHHSLSKYRLRMM